MKNVIKYLFGLLLALSFLSSCGKDDDEVATPQPGSIKATVSPAGAATAMKVTKDNVTTTITPDANSVFLAENLAEGQYSVTFTPATGYQQPAAQTVTVTAGNTTNLGTVTIQKIVIPGISGSMTATINGIAWSAIAPYAQVSGTSLNVAGPSATGTTGDLIAFSIQTFTGLGTYNGPTDAIAAYSLTTSTTSPPTWDSLLGSCTINITKYDQTNKLVSGSFSFVAKPSLLVQGNTATGTKTVTNGTFTDISFQ